MTTNESIVRECSQFLDRSAFKKADSFRIFICIFGIWGWFAHTNWGVAGASGGLP